MDFLGMAEELEAIDIVPENLIVSLKNSKQIVSLDFWYAICKTIADAGKRLKEINERIKKEEAVWKGDKLYKW